MTQRKMPVEPFKIKVVEPLRRTTREERVNILREAGLNVFNIPAENVFIDLLTDSGTSAMSDNQWSGIMVGDEAYAGGRSFFRFETAVKSIFGMKHVIPTHQGRAAERLLFEETVQPEHFVPNNIHFDTTQANVQVRGAKPVNLVVEEAFDPRSDGPFKGNMDVEKLENFVAEKGREKIPLVMLTVTNNSAAGQPVSMDNVRRVSRLCRDNGIPFFFDACRFAENAYFIQRREQGYENKSVTEIAREMLSYGDGATMSAKKDALVNIGGFLTLNDDDLAVRIKNRSIITEGFPTYGGLAGRDLEALARGLDEVLDEDYLRHRTDQTAYLAGLLDDAGVPVYKPAGGHAVYVLADAFLPHLSREEFPGWALTVALYREAGIRAVEIGSVMFAEKNELTGETVFPRMELVRLAIPRRVYTVSHIAYVAEALIDLYRGRDKIRGLRIVYEAPHLRHFTVRLEEL